MDNDNHPSCSHKVMFLAVSYYPKKLAIKTTVSFLSSERVSNSQPQPWQGRTLTN